MGLRIEKLSYSKPASEITTFKNEVYGRYGREGITILNMGSTRILIPLIQHLSNMKIESNYSQEDMLNYFVEIVHDWKKITIYHKFKDGVEELMKQINLYMDLHHEVFFVFGIGSAGAQAATAISSLSNEGIIQNKGYMFTLISRETDQMGRDHFTWFFKNNYTFDKITLRS